MQSVETNMNRHTVKVDFDDEATSVEDIVRALNDAGYMVPSYGKADEAS